MKNLIIGLLVVAALAVAGYFISSASSSSTDVTVSEPTPSPVPTPTPVPGTPSPAPSPTPTPGPTPVPNPVPSPTPPPGKTVSITNMSYSPASLIAQKGTKVTWVNNDTVPHTVTSDSGTFLNSPTLAPGQSYSVTFTELGPYNYHCAIHPNMKGSVFVPQTDPKL